jgi:hypothetical protein
VADFNLSAMGTAGVDLRFEGRGRARVGADFDEVGCGGSVGGVGDRGDLDRRRGPNKRSFRRPVCRPGCCCRHSGGREPALVDRFASARARRSRARMLSHRFVTSFRCLAIRPTVDAGSGWWSCRPTVSDPLLAWHARCDQRACRIVSSTAHPREPCRTPAPVAVASSRLGVLPPASLLLGPWSLCVPPSESGQPQLQGRGDGFPRIHEFRCGGRASRRQQITKVVCRAGGRAVPCAPCWCECARYCVALQDGDG